MAFTRRNLFTTSLATALGAGAVSSVAPAQAVDAVGPRINHWKLAFDENFNGNSVDTTKWNIRDSEPFLNGVPGTWGNAPGHTPTVNSAKCVKVENGRAIFHLEKLAKPVMVDGLQRDFKGGYLDSRGKFSVEYFRVEARMKMPSGPTSHGNHACLWFRPDDNGEYNPNATAPSLEIDLNEYYGVNYQGKANNFNTTQRTESSVHFDQTGKNKADNRAVYGMGWLPNAGQDLQNEWHIWSVEVTPTDGIVVKFDNKYVITHIPANDPRLLAAKKPGTKMHMRLNFEGGTEYWGHVTDANDLSGTMEVDYIRAWKYMV